MSMAFALVLLGMTILAVALLLVPLVLSRRVATSRDTYNLAVYRDQLAEIDRDVGRGVLEPGDAEAAKGEVARRILALTPTTAPAAASRAPLAAAMAAVILMPLAAWGLYGALGSPGLRDQPHGAAAGPHRDISAAVKQLETRLAANPDDLESWLLLGRTDLDLSRYPEAVEAYRHAVELSKGEPGTVGDWAEAQVLAAGGTVTPAAQQAFKTALADPDNAPRSRYYLALVKLQAGDPKRALQEWVDLEASSPTDAAWLPLLRERIANAAQMLGVDPAGLRTSSGEPRKVVVNQPAAPLPTGMPSSAAVEEVGKATANASPDQRQAMIDGMVAKLAARLEQQPDDAAGWMQLGRSYMVLNRPEKAQDAYARAVKLTPGNIVLKEQYAEAIIAAAGGDSLPENAIRLWREVLEAQPQNPDALWYVGLAEAAAGRSEAARGLWTRLLAQLTEGTADYREVSQRLAELNPAVPK